MELAVKQAVVLGIDVGTTYCKASTISLTGSELAYARVPMTWRLVPTGAEIDPATVLDAVLLAAHRALAGVAGPVAAIGVTSMAESGVLLDRAGAPLHPIIAWYDTRGTDQAVDLARDLGAGEFMAHTGLTVGPMPTIVKVRSLRHASPSMNVAARWLNVAEFIVRALGGEEVAERSLASRTGFLDQRTWAWWEPAVTWADVKPELFPRLVTAGSPAGRVRSDELARAKGAVLTVAGHDHLSAAVGAGAIGQGDVLNSCGTAEAVVAAIGAPLAPDRIRRAVESGISVGVHVIPNSHALLGGALCGIALKRFLDLLGGDDQGRAGLTAAALAAPLGARGLVVRNVLGEHAVLEGIDREVTPGLVWRAAIEAVEREALRLLNAVEAVAGPTRRLVVAGGWAQDRAVLGIKESILGPVRLSPTREAGARGAGLLAGVAAGLFQDILQLPEA